MDDLVKAERRGQVLVITLNRPDKLNALNRAMQTRLQQLFEEVREDGRIRALVITGSGRAFCSGADVGHLGAQAALPMDQQLVHPPSFTARQAKLYKPVICAVNGMCAGAGLHFVSDSDIVIASDSAVFTDTHVNVGQVSALEPIGLLQRTSLTTVLRMVILGKAERLSAAQALASNMISEVVADDRLMERAMELAELVCAGSPAAIQASLKAIWESFHYPLDVALNRSFEQLIRYRDHPDAKEGPAAFLEKRPPQWTDG
ncbi:hypothetical protein ASE00_13480 [Sphingomonas sp. Root710]|uniref:enoyl-CoA hydratase/isomerase family protein n=1 Tax=Sphingomonas sp. Root710 TaxID=1736594 RepID=UPI0006F22D79|nr:enoyl-CoA hydratase/isomerase family protein [Sphingomonas sp. Root710]KRB82996.1 hypothetical protein ASE00_13480 [Sphingomonas sp. Root710]